jgi:hypothetical protein
MERGYDLFEIFADHSVHWRSCVRGTNRALEALQEMGQQTINECLATELGSNEVVARVNDGPRILDDDGWTAN